MGYFVARLRRKFLCTGDFTFCYYERKPAIADGYSSSPTLLLLHGYNSEKTMWFSLFKHLPRDWGLIAVDMPGHGESSFKPKADYTPSSVAQKINKVLPAWLLAGWII